jgi:hypothetical protein
MHEGQNETPQDAEKAFEPAAVNDALENQVLPPVPEFATWPGQIATAMLIQVQTPVTRILTQ